METQQIERVSDKLRLLSQRRIAEVEDFIDFLRQRDESQQLRQWTMAASEATLQKIWNNTDDAEYDQL